MQIDLDPLVGCMIADLQSKAATMKVVPLTLQMAARSITANSNVLTQEELNKRLAKFYMQNGLDMLTPAAEVEVPVSKQQFVVTIDGVTNVTANTSYQLNAGHIVQERKPLSRKVDSPPTYAPNSNVRLLSKYRKSPAT